MYEFLTVTSSAFEFDAPVPKLHACQPEGDNVSPPLAWTGAPAGTAEFAVICDDPDAPVDAPWVHWVVYGIAAQATGLDAGIAPADRPHGGHQGTTDFDGGKAVGWGGPLPPKGHGVHHYYFKVYALDARLGLGPKASKTDLLAAMQGHVLAVGRLVGCYERK